MSGSAPDPGSRMLLMIDAARAMSSGVVDAVGRSRRPSPSASRAAVGLARVVVRVAEREQQLGAAALVGGVVELERLEGEVVRARRFLVRGRRRRPIAGTRRVVDRLVDVAARARPGRRGTRAR